MMAQDLRAHYEQIDSLLAIQERGQGGSKVTEEE